MTEVSGRLMHKNLDFLFQAVAQVHPCGLGSKMGLDACPELNRVPKIACKPERSVSTDAACPPADFIDPHDQYVEVMGQPVLADIHRFQELFQKYFAGMYRRKILMSFTSMTISRDIIVKG